VPDDQERDFRRFARRLLEAQERERDETDPRKLYTEASLRNILNEFCDVIAEDLWAESCTVYLRLYNPEAVPTKALDRWVEQHLDERKHVYPSGSPAREWREKLLRGNLCFPFWKERKGLSLLIAANPQNPVRTTSEKGPWVEALNDREHPIVAKLEGAGVSKQIYQNTTARFADRRRLRETRQSSKLGGVDIRVWTNQDWSRVFRNYSGLPIQIHSGGQVIGILKIENKIRFQRSHDNDNDGCMCAKCQGVGDKSCTCVACINRSLTDPPDLIRELKREFRWPAAQWQHWRVRNRGQTQPSILALSYLERDIEAAATTLKPHEDWRKTLLHTHTPGWQDPWTEVPEHLLPKRSRPPVQILTRDQDAEAALWRLLGPDESTEAPWPRLHALYEQLEVCGREFNRELATGSQAIPRDRALKFDGVSVQATWTPVDRRAEQAPFRYEVRLLNPRGENANSVLLDVMVAPIDKAEVPASGWAAYVAANPEWFGESRKAAGGILRRDGEFIEWSHAGQSHRILDLALDRLAARTEAYVRAQPLPQFTADDTRKLSWAACEIGKVIERHISYRANRADDPIPLTALDFFHIPIGDLSFVDELRTRRQDLEKVRGAIDVSLKGVISEMGFDNGVEYKARVKPYRSYLQRIGERHRAHRQGNVAIWLYLLSLLIKGEGKSDACDRAFRAAAEKIGDATAGDRFLAGLEKLRNCVRHVIGLGREEPTGSDGPAHSADVCSYEQFFMKEHLRILGDLKFEAPPAFVAEKFLPKAEKALLSNLADEGLLRPGLELEQWSDPAVQDVFTGLIFRHHADFVRESVSLVLQIYNRRMLGTDFEGFYRWCYWLRGQLCATEADIQADGRLAPVRELRRAIKDSKLDEYVDLVDTDAIAEGLAAPDRNKLPLTICGIYKRVRTVTDVLRHHRSVAALDWSLGRFDLYGAQMNCLYKSQVFALYDYAWNKGDPFFSYRLNEYELERFREQPSASVAGGATLQRRDGSARPPWLCLRTHVLEGEYNALQTVALVDPQSTEIDYWDSLYTLGKVREYLAGCPQDWDDPSFAEEYVCFAHKRNCLRLEYKNWHRLLESVIGRQVPPQLGSDDKKKRRIARLGSFLFERVLDSIMMVIGWGVGVEGTRLRIPRAVEKRVMDALNSREVRKSVSAILGCLLHALEKDGPADSYVRATRAAMRSKRRLADIPFACPARCWPEQNTVQPPSTVWQPGSTCASNLGKIYWHAQTFLEEIREVLARDNAGTPVEERQHYHATLAHEMRVSIERLKEEEKYYKGLITSDSFYGPLFYFDPASPGLRHRDLPKDLNSQRETLDGNSVEVDISVWYGIYRTLRALRREQRSFLFETAAPRLPGQKPAEAAPRGLAMRSTEEVLWRIRCYVLLYRPDGMRQHPGWTAHDLYYYIRSLLPVELQVRTELTNTFAVQYHDLFYKGEPPPGTRLSQTMLESVGQILEFIDREIGIDMEDYIVDCDRPETGI